MRINQSYARLFGRLLRMLEKNRKFDKKSLPKVLHRSFQHYTFAVRLK